VFKDISDLVFDVKQDTMIVAGKAKFKDLTYIGDIVNIPTGEDFDYSASEYFDASFIFAVDLLTCDVKGTGL